MSIGEAGSVTSPPGVTEGDPITITLDKPLVKPVYALTATNNDGDPFSMRVVNETFDEDGKVVSFDIIIEEYDYLDGMHGVSETINWIAIEEGTHTLPDGRIVEAGRVETGDNTTLVSFSGTHPEPPVVLTSVMSNNEGSAVDSDPFQISASGFQVHLQEEEALRGGGHVPETVGWIAIQPGGDALSGAAGTGSADHTITEIDLEEGMDEPVFLTDEQSKNGSDTAVARIIENGDGTVGVRIEEETSKDSETSHVVENVALVTFDKGRIPCFVAGTVIETPAGPRPVEQLKAGNLLSTAEGGITRVRHVFRRKIPMKILAKRPNLRPIRLDRDALGPGMPDKPLLVSRQHRMLLRSDVVWRMFGSREVLIPAHRLLGMPGVRVSDDRQSVTYVHVLCDRHSVLIANCAASESFLPGDQGLAALRRDDRKVVQLCFPALLFGISPAPARLVPNPVKQQRLVWRLQKNRKVLCDPPLSAEQGKTSPHTAASH